MSRLKEARELSRESDLETVKPLRHLNTNQSPILQRLMKEQREKQLQEEQSSYERLRRKERQIQYSKLINEVYVPGTKTEQVVAATTTKVPQRIGIIKKPNP